METLPKGPHGRAVLRLEIRSDNGSCYVSQEFRQVLKENGLWQQRIRPHCQEENGLMDRAERTLRESLEDEPMAKHLKARRMIARHGREVRSRAASQRPGIPSAV
ncbi:DDE-type integrase/transposase/recombinase [bacterium]|nr:DDE-type integrase/transposase/recombinase [bacterium]